MCLEFNGILVMSPGWGILPFESKTFKTAELKVMERGSKIFILGTRDDNEFLN